MTILAKSIWEQGSDEFRLQPLTDRLVTKAKEIFGIKLPEAYLNILKEQNGGHINYNAYPSTTPTAWGEEFISVDHIKGIGHGNGILNNAYFIKEWRMPEGLILFNGDGHTWIAFDYRSPVVNPPIVYVDNESGQLVQVAGNFDEFITRLYIEEHTDFEEDESVLEEYDEQDLENFIQQNNLNQLVLALMQLSQSVVDMNWLSKQLLQLSKHPSEVVRTEVAQIVWNNTYLIDNQTMNMLLKNFKDDEATGVQLFADLVEEKLDYPFEQLKQDVKLEGMASFYYQEEIFHVNEHSNLWHLSDYQTDFHSFPYIEELLEKATIKGKSLKEIWSKVKKV